METTRNSSAQAGQRPVALAVLAVWFGIALTLVLTGASRAAPGEPPVNLLLAVTIPVPGFLAWYGISPAFRDWVLGRDLRILTMMQSWRVLGGMFLVLMTFGLLPRLFAWPAGLGDVAIGVTAPAVALSLVRRPAYAASRGFLVWNLLGVLDLAVAVGTGVLASGLAPAFPEGIDPVAMDAWPLAMIPGFLVPLFIILHLVAILQAGRYSRGLTAMEEAGRLAG